jgi:hypothetical protein
MGIFWWRYTREAYTYLFTSVYICIPRRQQGSGKRVEGRKVREEEEVASECVRECVYLSGAPVCKSPLSATAAADVEC